MVARERAMVEAERARRIAEQARQRAEQQRDRAEALANKFAREDGGTTTIKMDQAGRVSLNGTAVETEHLPDHLQATDGRPVTIEAHPECLFGQVAKVMEACTKSGIKDVKVKATR
jgi:biopolymer transport protein ExbD